MLVLTLGDFSDRLTKVLLAQVWSIDLERHILMQFAKDEIASRRTGVILGARRSTKFWVGEFCALLFDRAECRLTPRRIVVKKIPVLEIDHKWCAHRRRLSVH